MKKHLSIMRGAGLAAAAVAALLCAACEADRVPPPSSGKIVLTEFAEYAVEGCREKRPAPPARDPIEEHLKMLLAAKREKGETPAAQPPVEPPNTSGTVPNTAAPGQPVPPIAAKEEAAEEPEADDIKDYKIGAGDVIDIYVDSFPELSGAVKVKGTGEIALPLVRDEVKAEGKTPAELAKEIRRVLYQYTESPPRVAVEVKESASRVFYVFGEASFPGKYSMGMSRVRLLDAILQANSGPAKADARPVAENAMLAPFKLPLAADIGSVLIITPGKDKKYRAVDVAAIIEGDDAANVTIRPNQIIFIPSRTASKAKQSLRSVLNFASVGILGGE